MNKCDHIVAIGYFDYFDVDDGNQNLITESELKKLIQRFGDIRGLIEQSFNFCPMFGKKI